MLCGFLSKDGCVRYADIHWQRAILHKRSKVPGTYRKNGASVYNPVRENDRGDLRAVASDVSG
jgi:hypothetical protein